MDLIPKPPRRQPSIVSKSISFVMPLCTKGKKCELCLHAFCDYERGVTMMVCETEDFYETIEHLICADCYGAWKKWSETDPKADLRCQVCPSDVADDILLIYGPGTWRMRVRAMADNYKEKDD